jgi:ABC-2 type transport system permease protein
MNGMRQGRLVAAREMRERSRSRAFLASVVLMVIAVAGAIALPALLDRGGGTKDVGLTGTVPTELAGAIQAQGDAVGVEARIHKYDSVAAGEDAVRDGKLDVLVVDVQQLEWRRQADEQLKALVTGAIQIVAMRGRAAAAGLDPDDVLAMVAPVPVRNVELGQVAGRSPDDETAAFILTFVLFFAISTYGAMVLNGVVEEKSSRTVEVLLARMPARNLLAGKIAGIGLLGLAQIAVTALAALVAGTLVSSVDIPAVRGSVIAWAVVWFVLGYALYATVFGTLGSLASRTEDASTVTGPVTVLLVAGFMVSFAAIGSPDTTWARLVSWFPATAPFAMPNRIAMGAATWWDPLGALVLILAAIAGLVVLGGRVYTGAILHTGATLKLRDAWHASPTRGSSAAQTDSNPTHLSSPVEEAARRAVTTGRTSHGLTNAVLISVAAVLGVAVFALAHDVIIGLAVGAGFYAVAVRVVKARDHAHR